MTQMSGAPYPLHLGDQTFQMSPMTDRDIDELSNWIRASIMKTARLGLTDDMTPFERDEILQAAVAKARAITFGEPSAAPYFRSPEGVARVFFQGVKKNHPHLTFEAFRPLVKTQDDIQACMNVWQELNLPQKHEGDGGEQNGAIATV